MWEKVKDWGWSRLQWVKANPIDVIFYVGFIAIALFIIIGFSLGADYRKFSLSLEEEKNMCRAYLLS